MSIGLERLAEGHLFQGRYRVVRPIGAGGVGALYEVLDERTSGRRALKVLSQSALFRDDLRARFLREGKLTGAIESEHVVRVLDAGAPDETPYILMELLTGEDLEAKLTREGRLSPSLARTLLEQAAHALARTHQAGLVHQYEAGAYTGEVSASMLAEFGCRYVIVGHSERRALFAEDDVLVGRKARAALARGLVPIVCVGETLVERDAGLAMSVIGRQLAAVLDVLGREAMAGVVLAYEPVWAIGSGRSATVPQVEEVHAGIRSWLRMQGVSAEGVRILYGGSVKPENAAALFAVPDVDGGLIGGASLVGEDFMAICHAAADAD